MNRVELFLVGITNQMRINFLHSLPAGIGDLVMVVKISSRNSSAVLNVL